MQQVSRHLYYYNIKKPDKVIFASEVQVFYTCHFNNGIKFFSPIL
jgi:hypothetical protein